MGVKESVADTAKIASRYVDAIMARLNSHILMSELAKNATIPVINGLTDISHPCQALSDLYTIYEKKGKLEGLKLAYFGDARNNVSNSLMLASANVGIEMVIACPPKIEYLPSKNYLLKAEELGKKPHITGDPQEAAADADIVYTDSWMSYHISEEDKDRRLDDLSPYRVNTDIMSHANGDAILMHCLPAQRGVEVEAEIIDGPQSVVLDQAENRLHAQKALLLRLLG
jgi:ornithine carbamoyltransferase